MAFFPNVLYFSKHGDCCEIHSGELFALISLVVSSLFGKCEIFYSFRERAVTLWCLRRVFSVSLRPLISCLVRNESRPSFSVFPRWHMQTLRGCAVSCGWALLLAVDPRRVKIVFSLGNTSLLDPTWSKSSKSTLPGFPSPWESLGLFVGYFSTLLALSW